MLKEIPVYIFTGFLEGGKTTFAKETLIERDFAEGDRVLLLVCEEGIEEYDSSELEKHNVKMVTLEDATELNTEYLIELQSKYKPERVMIEYNGTWKLDQLFDIRVPKGWTVVQIIASVDATTYEGYLNNMRAMMMEQVSSADMVIFNRCDDTTKRGEFRRSIRAVNRRAQVIFEKEDGSTEFGDDGEDLPYDMNTDRIELEDEDYGIWYIDAADNPDKYVGKTIRFKGMVYKPKQYGKNAFVPGRFAMTCCADDVAFVGFMCKSDMAAMLTDRQWVIVTATIKSEYYREFKGNGPVLYATKIEPAKQPEEELVYF